MKINKAKLITPLFALLPISNAVNAAAQTDTLSEVNYLEKTPKNDILVQNSKSKAGFGEFFFGLFLIATAGWFIKEFNDAEKSDQSKFMK